MNVERPAGLAAATCSGFLRESIEKKLAELRYNCGLQRLHLSNAHRGRWSGCPRQDPDKPSSWDLYWENLQAKAQRERPLDVAKADKELADFIAEHRPLMGADWVGNDHGRLCWGHYLGGFPIDQHYCQREEGHDGNCADEWPETRWACESPRGSWPKGVTCDREWRELIEKSRTAGAVPAHADESRPQTTGDATESQNCDSATTR